jgi:hypothetical protein
VAGQGDGDKPPAAAAPPGEPKPALELKLPEGVEIDKAQLAAFTDTAVQAGLNSEQASAIAAWDIERQKASVAEAEKAWKAQDEQWVKELQADKDIGGEKLKASVVAAKKAVRAYGGEDLANYLRAEGLGNNPVLVKAFAKIGLAMAEDTTGAPSTKVGPVTEDERLARFYNNSQPKGR